MKVTVFNSKPTNGKSPISPYGDNTFDFRTVEVEKLSDMFRMLSNNFILNLPLTQDLRAYRRKTSLAKYYPETFEYFILDIDKVKTAEHRGAILKYFKNYKCILGDSRSANGIDNFNLKGILCVEPIKIDNLKILVEQISEDLKEYGELDTAVTRLPSLNAPMNKFNVLLEGKGNPYKFVYRPAYKSKELTEIINGNYKIPEDLKIENARTIDQLCLQVFTQMGFKAIKSNGDCILFKHPSETKTPGGYFWFRDSPYTMHHYNEQKSLNLFNEITKLPEYKELFKKDINYTDKLLNFNINTQVVNVNEHFLKVTPEIKNSITSFLNQKDGLYAIKSPMGTGKSEIISEIIKDAHEQDMRVLICTNRISVAVDFANKYNLKLYNKDKYKLNDSIIVQYDSLWKYQIKNFDLVILDEFISLLLHSRNSINNSATNLAKFFACFNKKLVIADAFLTGYENNFLTQKNNLWMLDNSFRDTCKLYSYIDYNCFIQSILIHTKKHKVTISSTSLSAIHALKMLLSKHGLNVITLTAETPQMTKNVIYKIFQKQEEPEYDVLIYSPTLTVGVSNLNDIGIHFHYDGSSSCDVVSSLQMIKRTRKAKEIHLYVKNKTQYLKTTYKEIKDDYLQNLGKFAEHNYIFELNDYGEVKLSKLGKKAIGVDVFRNVLETNHKNAFMFLLSYQFAEMPEIISQSYGVNVLLPYIHAYKNSEDRFKLDCLEEYLSLSHLDRNCITDFKKQGLFEALADLETKLKPDVPNEIKSRILKVAINDNNFFDKIYKYKIIKSLYNKELSKIDIQSIISKNLNVSSEDLKFWNTVLDFDSPLLESYIPSAVNDNKKLKIILLGCGYKLQTVGMLKKYTIDENILEFSDYVCTEN